MIEKSNNMFSLYVNLSFSIDWLVGTKWRAVQNIGGIGNVTFLPSIQSGDRENEAIAFDTGIRYFVIPLFRYSIDNSFNFPL